MNGNEPASAGRGRDVESTAPAARGGAAGRVTPLVAWAAGAAVWVAARPAPCIGCLLFVLLGTVAILLAAREQAAPGAAALREPRLRQDAARAAWATGALGTLVHFMGVLSGPSVGLAAGARGMALSFLASLYGLALAAVLLAWRPRDGTNTEPAAAAGGAAPPAARHATWFRWVWRVLFLALVGWPFIAARLATNGPSLASSVTVLNWAAVLVVAGVFGALWLLGGPSLQRRAPSAALAGAGALGALSGLVQALLGFAGRNIAALSSGMSFAVTACLATLLGLALVASPLESRDRGQARDGGAALAVNLAWLLFPLLTLGLLALLFILILTPMAKPA